MQCFFSWLQFFLRHFEFVFFVFFEKFAHMTVLWCNTRSLCDYIGVSSPVFYNALFNLTPHKSTEIYLHSRRYKNWSVTRTCSYLRMIAQPHPQVVNLNCSVAVGVAPFAYSPYLNNEKKYMFAKNTKVHV